MKARLNRLFASDGRCLNVAIDHGLFGEPAFLSGIEDMSRTIATVVEAAPDALQLSLGQARVLQAIPGPRKPALVVRSDVANVYAVERSRYYFSELASRVVESALALDAACVVANILLLPNQAELYQSCLRNVSLLRGECEPVGMPLMVEPLVMRPGSEGYAVDGNVDKIVTLVRQAAELGADIIKADPTDNLDDYHLVIQAAGERPVLPRGGGRVPDRELLRRTETLMKQGASGIVYGRNVIQHPDPMAMTRALMSLIHDDASTEHALSILTSES